MPLRWCEFYYPQVDSTMDRARELVEQISGGTEVFTVRTDHQMQGRGRRGRGWYEQPGTSLLMTVAIRRGGQWDPRDTLPSTLALRSAAAVFTALHQYTSQQSSRKMSPHERNGLQIKWPNDILLDGGKLCGILLEAIPGWFLVGIGLNLLAPADIALNPDDLRPTGLYQVLPADSRRVWYRRIIRELDQFLLGNQWREVVGDALAWKGAAVEVRSGDSVQGGILDGVDPQGGLLLKDSQTDALLPPVFSGTVRLKGTTSSAAT